MNIHHHHPRTMAMTVLGVTLTYMGAAFGPFARVGSAPLSAFQYSTAVWSGLTIGMVSLLIQGAFLLCDFLLKKKHPRYNPVFQLTMAVYGSVVLDITLYGILGSLPGDLPYGIRMLLFLLGIVISAAGGCFLGESRMFMLPMVRFFGSIARKHGVSPAKYILAADIVMMVLAAVICLTTNQPFRLREGTVINYLLLARAAALLRPKVRHFVHAGRHHHRILHP